jgi:hypothetical protein
MSIQHSLAVPRARIDTERLRLNHPIADLITRYGIELRKSGSTLVGRCPFHQDGGRPNLTCVGRTKTNGDFGPSRTPISEEAEHRFRLMPIGHFG